MEDAENTLVSSKKRVAGRQLTRDNPGLDDEEEGSEQETGTFKRASDEVLANRRMVKVRRNQTSSASSAPSSNPFAAIRLVPPPDSIATSAEVIAVAESGKINSKEVEEKNDVNKETEKGKDENDKRTESKIDETWANSTSEKGKNDTVKEATKPESAGAKAEEVDNTENEAKKDTKCRSTENEDEKDNADENVQKSAEAASFSSFQQLSSNQNAFTGVAGTGFSSSTFSFSSSNSGSLFGLKNDQPSFSFSPTNNGNSLFGTPGPSIVNKSEGSGIPSMQEVPIETGEENEKAVFAADSVLFEFFNGEWKERGKGELKVNVSTIGTGRARVVMRAKGNYRLILNASLYSDMKLTNMEKRGITFACVNSTGEGKDGLSTFALKFKDASIVEEFRAAVTEHKGKIAVALNTPENSPDE